MRILRLSKFFNRNAKPSEFIAYNNIVSVQILYSVEKCMTVHFYCFIEKISKVAFSIPRIG